MEFSAFADEQLVPLLRYASALCGDKDLANDLVVDSLLVVWRRWPSVVGSVADPAAYVRQIITRRFIDDRRKVIRRRRIGERFRRDLAPPAVAGESPATAMDTRDQLHRLLKDLPGRQLAAVTMRYLLDLPDSAIAAELGCSQATVRSHISQALRALRQVATDQIAADQVEDTR